MATVLESAEASEFLADIVMKGGMMSGDGKVWGKGFRPENFVEMQQGPMEAQLNRIKSSHRAPGDRRENKTG